MLLKIFRALRARSALKSMLLVLREAARRGRGGVGSTPPPHHRRTHPARSVGKPSATHVKTVTKTVKNDAYLHGGTRIFAMFPTLCRLVSSPLAPLSLLCRLVRSPLAPLSLLYFVISLSPDA